MTFNFERTFSSFFRYNRMLLWLLLPVDYRVTDEALLAETT